MLVKGIVESSEGITHVLAGELIDCSHYLNEIEFKSRDFH
jgi:error-prone DNA polymerase